MLEATELKSISSNIDKMCRLLADNATQKFLEIQNTVR